MLYLDDDQQVAQADDQQRAEEAHGAGVHDEGRLPHLRGLGPHDAAVPIVFQHVGEHDNRQHHHKGPRPDRAADRLGHARAPPPEGADGVYHGQVAVHWHHSQAEDAGELVDGVHRHDHAAHEGAEGPREQSVLHRQEGQAQHEELVCDG